MAYSLESLEAERDRLKGQLAEIGDMRPGSLVSRYRKCGKPSCHCAAAEEAGHGPCWSLTRVVEGKTRTRIIPAGTAVERTREQLAEFRRFRELAKRLVDLSDEICEYKLRAVKQEPTVSKKNRTRARAAGRRRR